MKKFVLIVVSCLIGITTLAQKDEHMTFKGIPMDGKLKHFTTKLKSKGYDLVGLQQGTSILEGEFAGYKNCSIYVMADNSDNVCKVLVVLPFMYKWKELESCYDDLVSMLKKKYGEPAHVENSFESDEIKNDRDKVDALKHDDCRYFSIFNSEYGTVQSVISHDGDASCFVVLCYYDNANRERSKKKAMSDL